MSCLSTIIAVIYIIHFFTHNAICLYELNKIVLYTFNMKYDPAVWGPHYWFFLHTIAQIYPECPDKATRRKYYDLIHNMPTFLPIGTMGNKFSDLINKYPVTPYLDNRESLVRWVHFIHNKINVMIGKEEVTLLESIDLYFAHYKATPLVMMEKLNIKKHHIYISLSLICLIFIYIYSRES